MNARLRYAAVTAVLAVSLVTGCGGGGGGGTSGTSSGAGASSSGTQTAATASSTSGATTSAATTPATPSPTPTSTATTSSTSLPAVFSRFTSNVKVSQDGDFAVVETDDLPNHRSPYWPQTSSLYEAYNGTNPSFSPVPGASIQAHTTTFRIPLHPAEAATKQSTRLGPIGVSMNGVVFFNQYNGANQPLTIEINSFDQYNGHPTPQNYYHYHVEPLYLTQTLGKDGLIGFLADGFPVYGPLEGGKTLTNSDLDAYHGHFGVTSDYPEGIYHYHITSTDPYINGGQYFGTPGTISQ